MKFANIAIGKLKANDNNPRNFARDQDLEDLGKSIEAHGIIEPLVVRKIEAGNYEVLAGHRRLMAAEGILEELPCVVRDEEAGDGLVIALVENTQRVDLSPFEQAQAISKALAGMKQKDLAAAIGRSATYVSKFVMIMKAAKKLSAAGESDALDAMADYSNMEELYEYAKSIVGGTQKPLDLGPPDDDAEEGSENSEGEGGELTDEQALEKVINDHAALAKVKMLLCAATKNAETSQIAVSLTFKNIRDAEKFFLKYGVKV